MIEEHKVLPLLIEAYPQARSILIDSVDYWMPESGPIKSHSILSAVACRVSDMFILGEYDNSQELFDVVERFIAEGEDSVSNAACTCFIESLQNVASSGGEFTSSHFVSLMGIKSTEYAKSWDTFTGVKTGGI